MKFIFFNHDGHAISGVYSYGQMLHAAHPDCILLSLNDGTDPPSTTEDGRHFRLPFDHSHDTAMVAKLIGDIARRYPDDYLVLLPNNGTVPPLACFQALRDEPTLRRRARILATVHSDHPDAYALFVTHERYIAHFIGVSRHITANLSQALPHRANATSYLPCPVHLPILPPRKKKPSGSPLRLIYAGRLDEPQKRVLRLPKVAVALARRDIPFTLDLYGDGPARGALEEALNQLDPSIRQKIHMHGAVDGANLQICMQEYDVVLLVSAYEGTPLALLESMAAGLCPVVMDIASGIPELIRDGLDGYYITQGDIEGMAAVLAYLHDDRPRLASLQENARRRVAEKYSISQHLDQLNSILYACLVAPEAHSTTIISPFKLAIRQTISNVQHTATTVIWGGGMYGRSLVEACLLTGIQPLAIIESDPAKSGWDYKKIPYHPSTYLLELRPNQIIIGSLAYEIEIINQIRRLHSESCLPCPHILSANSSSK